MGVYVGSSLCGKMEPCCPSIQVTMCYINHMAGVFWGAHSEWQQILFSLGLYALTKYFLVVSLCISYSFWYFAYVLLMILYIYIYVWCMFTDIHDRYLSLQCFSFFMNEKAISIKPTAMFQVPHSNYYCNNKEPDTSLMQAAGTRECGHGDICHQNNKLWLWTRKLIGIFALQNIESCC